MPTRVPLATGSYVTADPRASSKRLVGAFCEIAPQTSEADSKQKSPPVYLRRQPGIVPFLSDGTSNRVRGIWKMGAINYCVIGNNLYSFNSVGSITAVLGTGILGSGFVRMADNTQCLFILVPGTSLAWTYCPNNIAGFSQFTNATFLTYGALEIVFVDTYFAFLRLDGLGFYTDDGQIASGTGPPTFLTASVFVREFGTDLFVGMAVDHREVFCIGELTSEGYLNAGNPAGSPFSSAPDSFMQIGMHPLAGFSIARQDQSFFWVANDKTVRRRNGQTPARVSNSGIEAILASADLTGCYALTPTVDGHPLWCLTVPAISRTFAYDCLTTEWFEPQSLISNLGYWRPLCWYNTLGLQLVGDSQSGQIGYLSTTTFTEFTTPMETVIETQSVYDAHNRIFHNRLELVMTAGGSTNIAVGALVTLFVSDDSGATWYARETKSLGAQGQRGYRAVWDNLGMSRDRVYKFQISDPTLLFAVDIIAELDGGQW